MSFSSTRSGRRRSYDLSGDPLGGLRRVRLRKYLEDGGNRSGDGWVWREVTTSDCYEIAEVLEADDDQMTILTADEEEVVVSTQNVYMSNPSLLDGVEDMTELTYLHEPGLLHNLSLRYKGDLIYTYAGLFVIAVNPYRKLPVYGPDVIREYEGKPVGELPPHVYAVVDGAYRSMISDKKNQSILISGESGAGKTETTKIAISYLAIVGANKQGKPSAEQLASSGVTSFEDCTMEDQIVQTSPILESFGNAKTLRNDNSSRFGKFIKINFDRKGKICGANIENYLLEKSRVVHQANGERNYHVFYQFCSGASDEERARYHLLPVKGFRYLSASGAPKVDSIDDQEWWADLTDAMEIMHIGDTDAIFSILAAILHLGNIDFGATAKDESYVDNGDVVKTVASLLNLSEEALETALCKKNIKAGLEWVVTSNTSEQAMAVRDGLAKAMYAHLFDIIVAKLNVALTVKVQNMRSFIGVLDIYGFEFFETNSFEQLCINYTNEKLQQFFNHHMFKTMQDEYKKEKIKWEAIDFGLDLQSTLDLVDRKPDGIFSLLDDECNFPKGTDGGFVTRINQAHKNHSQFEIPRLNQDSFVVKHFAGNVKYNSAGFLDKNKDPLPADLIKLMQSSSNPFVSRLFSSSTDTGSAGGGRHQRRGSQLTSGRKGTIHGTTKMITVATKYKTQLQALMDTLHSTNPHFIRCIKPNTVSTSGIVNNASVLHQVRCNGVREALHLARKGFPSKVTFAPFFERYQVILRHHRGESVREKCQNLITALELPEDDYRIGVTKVFMKAGVLGTLERCLQAKLNAEATKIQSLVRGVQQRKRYKILYRRVLATKLIQKNVQIWLERRHNQWIKTIMKLKRLNKIQNSQESLKKAQEEMLQVQEQLEKVMTEKAIMQTQKVEVVNKLNEVEAEADRLRENILEHIHSLNIADSKLGDIEDELKAKNDETQKLYEKLQQETGTSQKKQEAIDELDYQVKSLQEQLREKEAEASTAVKKLTKDRDAKANEIESLKNLVDELEDSKDGLGNIVSKLKAEIASLNAKIAKLEERVAQLEEEVDAEKKLRKEEKAKANETEQKLSDKLAETEGRLDQEESENRALKKKIKGLEDEAASTKASLEEEREENRRLSSELSKRQNEIKALQKDIDDTSKDLESTKGRTDSEITKLREKVKHLESELEAETAKLEESEEEGKKKDRVISQKEREISTLQSEAEELLDTKQKDAGSASQEISNLKDQIKQTTEESRKWEESFHTEQTDRKAKEREVARREQRISELDAEIESLRSTSSETAAVQSGEISSLQNQLRELTSAHSELKDNLRMEEEGRVSDNQKKSSQIDELNGQIAALESDLLSARSQVSSLTGKSKEADEEQEQLNSTIKSLQKDLKAEKEIVEQNNEEIANLKSQLEKTKEQKGSIYGEKEELEDSLRKEKSHVAKLKGEVEKLNSHLSDAGENIQKLSKEISSQKAKTESVQSSLEEKESECETLHGELSKANSALTNKVSELEVAYSEIEGKSKKGESLRASMANLQTELEEVKQSKTKADIQINGLQTELQTLMEAMESEQTQRAAVDAARKKLELEVAQLASNLNTESMSKDQQSKMIEKLHGDIHDLEQNLQLSQQHEREVEKQRTKLEIELSTTKDEVFELKEELNKAHDNKMAVGDELMDTQKQYEDELRTSTALRTDIEALHRQLADTGDVVKQLKHEILDRSERMEEDQQATAKMRDEFEKELQSREKQNKSLASEVAALTESGEGKDSKIADLNRSLEEAKSEVKTQSKTISVLEDRVKIAEQAEEYKLMIADLNKQVESMKSTLVAKEEEVDGLRSQIKNGEKKEETLKEKIRTAEAVHEKLRGSSQAEREERRALHLKCKEAEQQAERMRFEMDTVISSSESTERQLRGKIESLQERLEEEMMKRSAVSHRGKDLEGKLARAKKENGCMNLYVTGMTRKTGRKDRKAPL